MRMKELFSMEGRLMLFLQKTGELILVNIAFLVCCIPVITIVPAVSSFYYTVIKCIRRDRGNPLEEFFSSMKRTLGKGCLFTLEIAAAGIVLWLGGSGAAAAGRQHLEAVYIGLGALLVCAAAYISPVLSRFEMKMSGIWKLSFVMAVRFFPVTIAVTAGTALLTWLLIFLLPVPCILVAPGCWCLLTTFLMEKALLAYMPKAEDGEDAWYYGQRDRKQQKTERKEVRHEGL